MVVVWHSKHICMYNIHIYNQKHALSSPFSWIWYLLHLCDLCGIRKYTDLENTKLEGTAHKFRTLWNKHVWFRSSAPLHETADLSWWWGRHKRENLHGSAHMLSSCWITNYKLKESLHLTRIGSFYIRTRAQQCECVWVEKSFGI